MTSYILLVKLDHPVPLGSFVDLEKAKLVATQEAKKAHEIYGKRPFTSTQPIGCLFQLKNELGEFIKVFEVPHDMTTLSLVKKESNN